VAVDFVPARRIFYEKWRVDFQGSQVAYVRKYRAGSDTGCSAALIGYFRRMPQRRSWRSRQVRAPPPKFPEDKMASQTLVEQFRQDIGNVSSTVDERQLRQKSHDFHWYSPVLTPQLQNCMADVVVQPRSEEEIAARGNGSRQASNFIDRPGRRYGQLRAIGASQRGRAR
jgi:hypothetical protein